MKNKLQDLLKENKITSIYTNWRNTDKFEVGYVIECDEEYAIIEAFNQYGKSDGLFCILIEDVIKIENDCKYLEKIKKLNNYYNEKKSYKLGFKDNILKKLLNYIFENKKICTIELCSDKEYATVGFVSNINENTIEISAVDLDGNKDGTLLINVEEISYLSCDSNDNEIIGILYNLNND